VSASVPSSNLPTTIPETQLDNTIPVSVSHTFLHQDLAISDDCETSDEKDCNKTPFEQTKPSVNRIHQLSASSSEGESSQVVRLTSRQRHAMRRDRQKTKARTLTSFKKDVE
jgi:hypothetical protein